MAAVTSDFTPPFLNLGEKEPNLSTKIMRPLRLVEKRDPIRWGMEMEVHDPASEYTEKYVGRGTYRKLQPIMPNPQINPRTDLFHQDPSVYRQDFIKMETGKPPVRIPLGELQLGSSEVNSEGDRFKSTYRDTYPEIVAYAKRQAITNKPSHWIKPPPIDEMPLQSLTSYERDFHAPYADGRRQPMKKEVPYQSPDVGMAKQSLSKSDFQWSQDMSNATRRSLRPQEVATIPAPFDSQSHNRLSYVPHDSRHYLAAFDDLVNPIRVGLGEDGVKSSRVPSHEGDIDQVSKRRGRPPSPDVPEDLEALITARTTGRVKSERERGAGLSGRLEALQKRSQPQKKRAPNFASTYSTDFFHYSK